MPIVPLPHPDCAPAAPLQMTKQAYLCKSYTLHYEVERVLPPQRFVPGNK